ncbi:unnamed protein product, partial [Linum tenue]
TQRLDSSYSLSYLSYPILDSTRLDSLFISHQHRACALLVPLSHLGLPSLVSFPLLSTGPFPLDIPISFQLISCSCDSFLSVDSPVSVVSDDRFSGSVAGRLCEIICPATMAKNYPTVNEDYKKSIDKAKKKLRALIAEKNCAPLMLRLA